MNRINANKKPDKMIILLFFSILSLTAISQNAEKKITIQNKNISLKEANETEYWLMLLKDSDYITNSSFESIHQDCRELIKLLASIVKTTKNSITK